ncbi:MAG: hypothetical protein ACM3YN_08605 [Parcubacteria group bacterium]
MTDRPPILMQRRGEFLIPQAPIDGERIRDLPAGKPLRIEVRQPRRSNPQLRLYWAILGLVCDNLDQPLKPEALHEWLKMRLGVVEPIKLRSGAVDMVPGSVAFDKMEHADFTAYMQQAKDLLVRHIIPGLNSEALEREARAMLGLHESEEVVG